MEKHKLYEQDFYGWALEQADLLSMGNLENLDIINLIEELKDLGNSQASKLQSYLTNVFLHKLKIKYQPCRHSRSWDLSIKFSTNRVLRQLKKNPSLKSSLMEIFKEAYEDAIAYACKETGLEEETFPEECPWTQEEIIGTK